MIISRRGNAVLGRLEGFTVNSDRDERRITIGFMAAGYAKADAITEEQAPKYEPLKNAKSGKRKVRKIEEP